MHTGVDKKLYISVETFVYLYAYILGRLQVYFLRVSKSIHFGREGLWHITAITGQAQGSSI